jgi:UDP:flavonoid glycosyltransferase YjiC (YdhE family)
LKVLAMMGEETSLSKTGRSRKTRFLFAHWEGGGNTPPMLAVVRRLVARGHAVRVVSDPCNRAEVEATGATFVSWMRAPSRPDKSVETDLLRDWEVKSPPAMIGRLPLGLQPLQHPFDQLNRLARHLVLTSAVFDFQSSAPPEHLVYAGPELDDPVWTESWRAPWSETDRRPLVLVGFSTTFQNQSDVLRRVIEALSNRDFRVVVTAGPSVEVAAGG